MAVAGLTCFLEPPSSKLLAAVKQGAAINHKLAPLLVTVDGTAHEFAGAVATAAAVTIYDATLHTPTSWDVGLFWCDQTVHLQLIDVNSTGSNVVLNITATQPFRIPSTLVAAANETAITNGTTTLRQVDKIILGNSSGSTANYALMLIT